jgi:hypothetical protein
MHCPYCTSDINEAALVCPVCSRDLYLFKPLLQRISDLEKLVQADNAEKTKLLESRLAALEEELAQLRRSGAENIPASAAKPRKFLVSALIVCIAVLALLLVAHALIIIAYDLKPLYLRVASLLIPLPFGFALYVWHPRHGWVSAFLAALVACAAVLGMSAVTGRIDHTPVLPQDLREWREFIEYSASIAFSFATGLLLGKLRYHRLHAVTKPGRLVVFLAQLFAKDEHGQLGLQKTVTRLTQIGAAIAPAASAVASVYTGIKAVIGDS